MVADPGIGEGGWPEDSLRLFAPIGGLAPWSGALVAMVPLQMLGSDLAEARGINPDRPEHVDTDYVQGLLCSSTLPGWQE